MEDENQGGFPSVWSRASDLEEVHDSALEYDAFEQGRMLGDMDHDSASLLPDTEAAFGGEHPPRQPNSKDAADTLTQFAFRLQGETKGKAGSSGKSGKGGGGYGGQERGSSGRRQSQQHLKQEEEQHGAYGHTLAVGSAIAAKSLSPRKRRRLGMDEEEADTEASVGQMTAHAPMVTPSPCPPPVRHVMTRDAGGGCDAHFIVHLFVTAIADGRMQQDDIVPKTWDVLQQVITKVSKEQNTSITLHGLTMDIKMRVFVCNSVEARAVGEYVTAHKDQRPAPFVVLARQLSMAIAYNSAFLDPSQAAVADRLRKQAKTRAVKEIREAVRDAPPDISGPVLRGYVGALAPAAHIEALLLRRTVKVDLEGDEERAYIFFDAKNRSTAKDSAQTSAAVEARPPSVSPQLVKQAAPAQSGARGRKSPTLAQMGRQPHQSPVNARVQALQAPGSPLSPGGRDGAAALLSLFNSVSTPDSPRGGGPALPRHRAPYPAGDYFGQVPGDASSSGSQGPSSSESDKAPERPLSGRSHPKHSLAAQAAANANAMAPHSTAAPSFAASRAASSGSPFGRVPRPQVAIPDAEGYGGDASTGGLHGNSGGYDLNLVIASPKLRPASGGTQASLGSLSIDHAPGCLLDAGARTPRSVGGLTFGWHGGGEGSEHKLYAAVNAGDSAKVEELLETPEGIRMVDEPISAQAPGNGNAPESRALQRHHLIPDSVVEYEVEDGVWWPAVVVSSIPGADHVTVRYHRPGAQAPIGEPPLSRETKLDKKSSKLRVPSDSPKDFTALMCACMLDAEEEALAMALLLLNHQADPNRTDSEGFSAVHWAAVKGHPKVLQLLCEKKALFDAPSSLSGETPLLLAARYGRKEAVDVLLAKGAQWDARTRQRLGLLELLSAGRAPGCTDVLHLVLERQPALRTLLLHFSFATCNSSVGCEKEAGMARQIIDTVRQSYKPEILTIEEMHRPGEQSANEGQADGDGVRNLVKHAVEKVAKGYNRNCCCCLPYTDVGRRLRASHAHGLQEHGREGRQECVEITAALHAAAADETVRRVAVLDLDGSGGDVLEEQVCKLAQDRLATQNARSQRDASVFYFSPETAGSDTEGRNLVMNILRPCVGSKLPVGHGPGEAPGAARRTSDAAGMVNGTEARLSAAGTRDLLRQAIVSKLVPCLRAYAPDFVVMSAAYPSASSPDDSLQVGAPVPLMASDYEWATREISKVAGVCCKGRVLSLLLIQRSADLPGVAEKGAGDEPGDEQTKACVAHVRALVGC